MSRYHLPDPKCSHKPTARVEAGDVNQGPYVSSYVCARMACVEDVMEWARASTHLEPRLYALPKVRNGRAGEGR